MQNDIPRNLRTSEQLGTDRVYVIKLKQTDSTLAAWCFLTHKDRFEQERFKEMITEASSTTTDVRVQTRRNELAANHTPIKDAVATNETLFDGDAAFFEAVMCDRFGFKKLFYTGGEGQIEPTVKGVGV